MEQTIERLKALGDENRFRIFMMLGAKSMCACELREVLQIAGSTLSAHLKILRAAGLITQKKNGRWVEFTLNSRDSGVPGLLAYLENHLIQNRSPLLLDRETARTTTRDKITGGEPTR